MRISERALRREIKKIILQESSPFESKGAALDHRLQSGSVEDRLHNQKAIESVDYLISIFRSGFRRDFCDAMVQTYGEEGRRLCDALEEVTNVVRMSGFDRV